MRQKLLAGLDGASTPAELLAHWPDGRIKMFLVQKILQFRRAHPEIFRIGAYRPLKSRGAFADSCIAFAREKDGQWIVVIAPRLSSRVGFPPIGEKWKDTVVELPEGFSFDQARDLFTGASISAEGNSVSLAQALAVLPFAALTNAT